MSNKLFLLSILASVVTLNGYSQIARKNTSFPQVGEYQVLKCDFHQHTIFSDGEVWPSSRVSEAWQEGLDAICITDHIEYRPFHDSKDLANGDHNRAWEIAASKADQYDVIVIRGAEITRNMAPGHLNAVGVKDANAFAKYVDSENPSDTTNVVKALREAKDQGAFIMWNHPDFPATEYGESHWFPIHEQLYQEGLLDGIEIVNGGHYDENSMDWALEKDLVMLGNTDVHGPMAEKRAIDRSNTMTLVLAKDKSEESIMEALYASRTAVIYRDQLIGREEIVSGIVKSSLLVKLRSKDGKSGMLEVSNNTDIPYKFEVLEMPKGISIWVPSSFVCEPCEISGFTANIDNPTSESRLKVRVLNVFTANGVNLEVELPVEIL